MSSPRLPLGLHHDPIVESLQHAAWLAGTDALIDLGVDAFTAVTSLDPRNPPPGGRGGLVGVQGA